jgi:glycerol-3-phosphate dehydrogenase
MAKDVVDAACRALGKRARCTTDTKPLPGGLPMDYEQYLREAIPALSSQYRVAPELVRHLIGFYGSRAVKVLELKKMEPEMGKAISPESRDISAQVLYSVLEEGARTLSDIVLRRMHLGMSASRGVNQAEKIADIAGRALDWSKDNKHNQINTFINELQRETACLNRPAGKGNVC